MRCPSQENFRSAAPASRETRNGQETLKRGVVVGGAKPELPFPRLSADVFLASTSFYAAANVSSVQLVKRYK